MDGKIFLQSVIQLLSYYKDLGDKTFDQLSEEEFHILPAEESNSIAMIMQHMHGNMMSRWTDFLTTDGEKEWRKRDAEFEEQQLDKKILLQRWNAGWHCFLEALQALREDDLTKTITIRNEPLSVTNAILRQLTHTAYHVGQIIYAAKNIKGKSWQNLSMPKTKSTIVNAQTQS